MMNNKKEVRLNDNMKSFIDEESKKETIVLTVEIRPDRKVMNMLLDAGKERKVEDLVNKILKIAAEGMDIIGK